MTKNYNILYSICTIIDEDHKHEHEKQVYKMIQVVLHIIFVVNFEKNYHNFLG